MVRWGDGCGLMDLLTIGLMTTMLRLSGLRLWVCLLTVRTMMGELHDSGIDDIDDYLWAID